MASRPWQPKGLCTMAAKEKTLNDLFVEALKDV